MLVYASELGMSVRAHVLARTPAILGNVRGLVANVVTNVAYVHAHGVAHNDLTPSNVIVLPDMSTRLIDFDTACFRDVSITQFAIADASVSAELDRALDTLLANAAGRMDGQFERTRRAASDLRRGYVDLMTDPYEIECAEPGAQQRTIDQIRKTYVYFPPSDALARFITSAAPLRATVTAFDVALYRDVYALAILYMVLTFFTTDAAILDSPPLETTEQVERVVSERFPRAPNAISTVFPLSSRYYADDDDDNAGARSALLDQDTLRTMLGPRALTVALPELAERLRATPTQAPAALAL